MVLFLIFITGLFLPIAPALDASAASNLSSNPVVSHSNYSSTAMSALSLGPMQTGQVDISIGFSLRGSKQLNNFIGNKQQQFSGVQPLSEEQFEEQYSPIHSDYNAVQEFLLTQNLTVTQTFANRLLLNAKGSVKDVQRAFSTEIGLFSYMNSTFYKSTTEIKVPASLSSYSIEGIKVNNFSVNPYFRTALQSSKNNL